MGGISRFTAWAVDQLVVLRAFLFQGKEMLSLPFIFYERPLFALADLLLYFRYFFSRPYKEAKKQGGTYGETPLSALAKMAKKFRILSHHTLFELGSGRGRNCFWLAHFVRCRVVGIEKSAMFTQRAEKIAHLLRIPVEFRLEDFFKSTFSEGSFIYLYALELSEEDIKNLCHQFAKYKELSIITISYALSDYDERFITVKKCHVWFPWGRAEVFLSGKRK